MKALDRSELKELLLKCWMTHDASWFYNCLQELGIEPTNRINKAAIRSLAAIELPRITRALAIELDEPPTFEQLKQVIDGALSVVKGDFMDFDYSFPLENILEWRMNKCFAYEGMKKLGIDDRYECGILYRVCCWIEGLGAEYEIESPFSGCLMHEKGFCSSRLRFKL